MGKSLLLGLGEIIGNAFSTIFNTLLAPILEGVLVPIMTGLIRAIIMCVQFVISGFMYEISVFLLNLVDFVELLFRSLAGLSGGGVQMSIPGTTAQSDLLIQFLTSKEVIEAFYATCIVGLFLLIITTIFQMIKVEYTTEGANNTKSTILNKSLKSLANMLLIPLLCIFGVIIGNQVLGLIDTATRGADGAKISGTLFMAAASNAMLAEVATGDDIIDNNGKVMGKGIDLGITIGLKSLFDAEAAEKTLPEHGDCGGQRDAIEAWVSTNSSEANYANVAKLSKYYDIFSVNYLVLVFGTCLILKSLFYVCFGMIDRLYQCVALFIVSPMVIGMTPVKDSLGSWRGKFIGKALSAYGFIISLNLFFIIVKVMLSIEFKWSIGSDSVLNILGPTFLTGLVKSIMVIVGCLMIEKLAGDLGQYFGASDGLKEGSGLAKDTTAGLKKAAVIAGGVATGGIGLAMKGVKASAGVASKIALNSKNAGGLAFTAKGAEKKAQRNLKRTELSKNESKNYGSWQEQKAHKEENEAKMADAKNRMKGLDSDSQEYKDAMKDFDNANMEATRAEAMMDNYKFADKYESRYKAEKNIKAATDRNKEVKTNKEVASKLRRDKIATSITGVGQMAKNTFGVGKVLGAMGVPGSITGLPKQWNEAVKQGNAVSPEGQQMLDNIAGAKKKAAEEAYNKSHSRSISHNAASIARIESEKLVEKTNLLQEDQNKSLKKLNDTLEKYLKQLETGKDEKGNNLTDQQKDNINERILAAQNAMQGINKKIDFTSTGHVDGKFEIDLNTKEFEAKITEAIKKNASKQDFDKIIAEQLKKWGETGNETVLKELHKVLEELKNIHN